MSSRLLTGEKAAQARPIAWEIAPGPGGRGPTAPQAQWEEAAAPPAVERKLAELAAEAAAREAEARRVGFAEGQEAARRNLEAGWREAMERLARTLAELAGLRQQLRQDAEEDLVRLAVAIARRILHRELSIDPQAILGLAKAALEQIELREVLRIRAHPEDARLLEASLAAIGAPDRVEVAADGRLERGALIVESERGELDASVRTQLDEIERGLADLIRRQP